jgi:hypothetical protein
MNTVLLCLHLSSKAVTEKNRKESQTTAWKTSSVKELELLIKYLHIDLVFLALITQMRGKVIAAVKLCSFSCTWLQAAVLQH